MKVLRFTQIYQGLAQLFEYVNDFFNYTTATDGVSSLAADAGVTVASTASAVGGVIALGTSTTNNNECAVATTNSPFKFADDKPMVFEAYIQYAEANTNAANVFAGFSSAFAADLLVDDGAGPATTMSAAGIYKVDGETVWRTVSSKSTTQTITKTGTTAGGSAYQRLRIEVQPVDATNCEVTYYVDGVQLRDTNNAPIKDLVAYSSAAAMKAGVYVKCGSTSAETVSVDYLYAAQQR